MILYWQCGNILMWPSLQLLLVMQSAVGSWLLHFCHVQVVLSIISVVSLLFDYNSILCYLMLFGYSLVIKRGLLENPYRFFFWEHNLFNMGFGQRVYGVYMELWKITGSVCSGL